MSVRSEHAGSYGPSEGTYKHLDTKVISVTEIKIENHSAEKLLDGRRGEGEERDRSSPLPICYRILLQRNRCF